MPIISLFHGVFCNEERVIKEICGSTGYPWIKDADIVSEASRISKMNPKKIERVFSAKTSVFNKFTHEKERSIAHLKLALAQILPEDNRIFTGFTSQLIPREISHALRLCLIADTAFRIAAASKEIGIPENDAAKLIRKNDEDCTAWVQALSIADDPWDASNYDILIPVDKMSVDAIVSLVKENVQKDVLQPTKHSGKILEDFLLASRVEVALVNEGHNVGVKAQDGGVTITINKHALMLNRLEEELKNIARRGPGVDSVKTKVGPGFHQADIYRKFDFEVPSKVLLVDDEREFVQTLSERLLMRDMGSTVAYDGESALELIKQDEPEVMILDLRMPGIDGIEVLKKVKKTNPDIEVIILTGHGSEADRETCMHLGAFAYLQKPVDIDKLSETIKKANEKIRLKDTSLLKR